MTHENILKFHLKICFLFEAIAPPPLPSMKISKTLPSPLFLQPPSPPLILKNFSSPQILLSSKIQSPTLLTQFVIIRLVLKLLFDQ